MQDPRQAYSYQATPAAYHYAGMAPTTFYGQYPQQGYQQQVYQQAPAGFGRGRGAGNFGRGGFGYGGRGGYSAAPAGYEAGFGGFGRGGMMMRGRRKRPFVGGSLETQRQWEQSTLCCFSVQGQCKFGDHCRFSHTDDGVRQCQFGAQCRVGHNTRAGVEQQAPAATVTEAPTA